MADDIEEIEQETPFDAYDEKAIEKAKKAEKRQKNKRLRVVASIMAEKEGRAWMFDVLGTNCHIFSDNPMRDTPERNGRYEGERAVGLRLLDEIMQAAPESFWLMRKESLERQK